MSTTFWIGLVVVVAIVAAAVVIWAVTRSRRAAARASEPRVVDPVAERERELNEARELREAMELRAERRDHEAQARLAHNQPNS